MVNWKRVNEILKQKSSHTIKQEIMQYIGVIEDSDSYYLTRNDMAILLQWFEEHFKEGN